MTAIDPTFLGQPFKYSFENVNVNHAKLKKQKLNKEFFKKLEVIFQKLSRIESEKLTWERLSTYGYLYSGKQAHPIKEVIHENTKNILENAFAEGEEVDSPFSVDCYPSYLSITKEIRLFGYQWEGVFKVVIVDLDHEMMKRK